MKKPLVSICCITYNHEKFIAQAIEGFLMQKTSFDFEINIGEDCSTDTTKKIIEEYIKKFPQRINLFASDSNYGAMINFKNTYSKCNGKYITISEGDDYWTDPNKLQKQVDFLEQNEDFAICFHNMNVIYDNDTLPHLSNPEDQKDITTIEDLAEKGNYITTSSCLFRNYNIELPEWFYEFIVGDYILHLLNARYGKIYYMNQTMGVYRIHSNGAWGNKHFIYKHFHWIHLLDVLNGKFDENINAILKNQKDSSMDYIINFLEFKNYENDLMVNNILHSSSYKLGNFILSPFIFIKKLFHA
jgi:glycosyltransferase involved in cell wall biosynthesis